MKKPAAEGQSPKSVAADLGSVGPSQSAMPDQPQTIAGVIGVVPGEVSPEEKARARQALNALRQIRGRSPRPTEQNADSRPSKHLEATTNETSARFSRLDEIVAPALAGVGYEKVAKRTYRGDWSTPEVEHILTFDADGTPKIYLYGDAGLRNPQASAFALQCWARYADPVFMQYLREDGYVRQPWYCPTHFPIGILTNGKLPWWLDMSAYSPSELARTLAESVRSKLVPFVSPVTSAAALLEFVERNEEPVLWARTGGCLQAAIVAFLAASLGVSRATTKPRLLKNTRSMTAWLDETRLTPETYIDHILDDAEAAVAQAAT